MKRWPQMCAGVALLAMISCATLFAQAPRTTISRRSETVRPTNEPDPGLTAIYSNLGSQTDAYDDGISYQISGPGNLLFGKGYLGMPFTPSEDSTAKEILIALGYLGGGNNGGTIGLVEDDNGGPGTPIKTWTSSNFQKEGNCCVMVALKDANGISLEGGVQYWIVAGVTSAQDTANYQWNFVWNDASGPVAFLNDNTNGQWFPYTDNLAAFAIYGTTP
ncbi:MAG: hypothetical protein WAM78_13625 [Candidatus Sulfotelmatobacter sp.]